MSTKNTRLRFADLFNGRLIYLAEPGQPVLTATVGQKCRSMVPVYTISFCNSVEKPVVPSGKTISANAFVKQFPSWADDINTEVVHWVTLNDNSFQSNSVYLDIQNTQHKEPVEVQDIYFDPNESRLRAFRKMKQAEKYAARVAADDKLESLFPNDN